jgi:hypothetical protein
LSDQIGTAAASDLAHQLRRVHSNDIPGSRGRLEQADTGAVTEHQHHVARSRLGAGQHRELIVMFVN